jgi:hypothetical protein
MAAHRRLQNQLIGLWLYIIRKLSRRRKDAVPRIYLAYSIGPEMLAILARELDALTDEAALREAMPLFHDGLKRIEVWCGRIPPTTTALRNAGTRLSVWL